MPGLIHLKDGAILQLEQKPFASGGEGELFRVVAPAAYQSQVAKLYRREKRTRDREKKTEYLVANPPVALNEEHRSIVWATHPVFENGAFAGFLMPHASGEKLELLCHPQQPARLGSDWKKFDFKSPEGVKLRQKICFNIAVALYHVHRHGKYVLVDMKPENIIIQPNGLISLIDIDSLAVVNNGNILFPGPVVTPDYAPPEYYNGPSARESIDESWDRFSMAVIFYRLLCGIHPFAGSCRAPYDKYHGLAEMIRHGLFASGANARHFKVIPPPHANFQNLDVNIREMFVRCFDTGCNSPADRPSAGEWCAVLMPPETRALSRQLPSAKFTLPALHSSMPLTFDPGIDLAFPDVEYLMPRRNIVSIIGKIFKRSASHIRADELARCEMEIRKKMARQVVFEKKLATVLHTFQKTQAGILSSEQQEAKQLQQRFTALMAQADRRAQLLLDEEIAEIKNATAKANTTNLAIDGQVQQLYRDIVETRTLQFEAERKRILDNIARLEARIEQESNRLMANPAKLIGYRIDTNAAGIFGANEHTNVHRLSMHGIATAADFLAVDSTGRIHTRTHGWVKVPGIAKVRGKQLSDWRRNAEARENRTIAESVRKAHNTSMDQLRRAASHAETCYQQEIAACNSRYAAEKEKLMMRRKDNTIALKNELDDIEKKYTARQLQIFDETKEAFASIGRDFSGLSSATAAALSQNLEAHQQHYQAVLDGANTFLAGLRTEITALKALQNEVARSRQL